MIYNFPDYKIKDNIKNLVNEIQNDIDYFKNRKQFLSTVENIDKLLKTNTINNFFKLLINKLDELSEEDIIIINKYINSFYNSNLKKYIKKITNNDWTVYEYTDSYTWYIINKNTDIIGSFNLMFKDKTIISIYIDDFKRKTNDLNELLIDFKHANKIKIIIKK